MKGYDEIVQENNNRQNAYDALKRDNEALRINMNLLETENKRLKEEIRQMKAEFVEG